MKMFGTKSVSVVLFYLSALITVGLFLLLLFILLSWFTGLVEVNEEGIFKLKFPLSSSIISGKYQLYTLLSIGATFAFYGVFTYLLSGLFKTFTLEPLFKPKAIQYLRYFTIANLLLPVSYFILVMILPSQLFPEGILISFLHLIVGLFAAFISAIFKQGVVLQEEQNLTI